MNALETILQTGTATKNEIILAKRVDELTEEIEKLKPKTFKVIQPMFKVPVEKSS